MKVTSDFALLDVKRGRHRLAKLMPGYEMLPKEKRIPVTITGFVSQRWGQDDGVSIEFGVDVRKVEFTGDPMAKAAKKPAPKLAPKKPALKKAAAKKKRVA
jgi:hypothetical protein